MTAPRKGLGAIFSRYDGTTTWDVIGEVTAITPPGPTADTIETTALNPTDRHRTFIKGLIDGGEVSVTLNFDPLLTADAENQALLKADVESATDTQQYAVEFSDDGATVDFDAVATGFTPGELTPDGIVEATFTMKITGKPAWQDTWAN